MLLPQYKEKLIKKGASFKTQGDTEVLLKLYESKGIEFLRDKGIDSLYSIAIFFCDNLYFFNKSDTEKFDLIVIFFPFNCIFAIIKLINNYNYLR